MKGEKEINNTFSNNNRNGNRKIVNGVSISSSCSSTNGFCFSDVGSSSFPSSDHSQFPSPKSHFVDQFSDSCCGRVNNGVVPDALGLAREFGMMNIGNRVSSDTEGFRVSGYNVPKIRPSNGLNYGSFEGYVNGLSGNGGVLTSLYRDERNIRNLGDSFESIAALNQSRNRSINFLPVFGGNECYGDRVLMNRTNGYLGSEVPIMRVTNHSGNGGLIQTRGGAYSHLVPLQVQSMHGPQMAGNTLQQCMMQGCNDPWACSQNSMYTQALSRENKLYNSMREKMKAAEEGMSVGEDNSHIDPMVLQSMYTSMAEIQGSVYLMAKNQHGCRFLQKKFEIGSFEDVQLIFSEIIDHVVELMMDPFGNYLIQKLLGVCNEEQKMKILHAVTKDRGELVRICLNTHGTRVVQTLIESLKTKQQISMVIRALEPGFLNLIKDLNGNHVVQRCLQCLSSEDNKFIFDGAAKFCVEIATHRHGCCVLQRCVAHSTGEHQKKLVEQICANALHLAQDSFGNYVVQYIIGLRIPAASAQLTSEFEGHYIHLATQKFSSHVVEKCLKHIEASRPRIVYEFLSVSYFEQLLQDPFANYVIQSALEVTKGPLNDSLVAAVRPHSMMLHTNPYCKKIFSRGMLKHK